MNHAISRHTLSAFIFSIACITQGCFLAQRAEYLGPSASLPKQLDGAFSPSIRTSDVFLFHSVGGIALPFMFGLTDLYIEMPPSSLQEGAFYSTPSDTVRAHVCEEIHPGIFYAPTFGKITVLRNSSTFTELDLVLSAERTDLSGQFRWSISRGIAFSRTPDTGSGVR